MKTTEREDKMDWIDLVARDIAELPDRTSPDDWPEAMLVTADELRRIIESRLKIGGDPLLPNFVRKRLEGSIEIAIHQKGMSVHDGKARVDAMDLKRLLMAYDAIKMQAPEVSKEIGDFLAKLDANPAAVDGYTPPTGWIPLTGKPTVKYVAREHIKNTPTEANPSPIRIYMCHELEWLAPVGTTGP